MRTPILLLAAAVSTISLGACGGKPGASQEASVKVLATVNGAPITVRDLEHRWKRGAKGAPGHDATADANVLETLVREELVYQKAAQLGLDRDEEYRVRLDDLEAQVRAFKRQEMATRLRMWALQQSAVSDAEARAWFDANAALVRSRLHVLQILYKGDRAEAPKDAQDVKAGAPFEDVAARRYGTVPAGARPPWDLGEVAWHQLPPQWRGIVDRLEPGQVSSAIEGEGDRAWVVKLVARRVEPAVSFETEKAKIVDVLASEKARALYDRVLAEAKAKAAISYAKAN